ncbi:MAG: hypothetical protein K6T78_06905 [Alicyclobacillus sp.]|nr:hypothetical protein [Alicyclobacillus sp.]
MTSFGGIIVIAGIVAVDNALLAGLLLPHGTWRQKKAMVITIGLLLAATQIVLAAGVDRMLHNVAFRLIGIVLLSWMCIRTLQIGAGRAASPWQTAKLWLYTTVGNLDNMFWLGSELKGDRLWLIVASLATIPLFVAVALFLSQQCEKQTWILHIGAGMMAWAAAALTLDVPAVKAFIGNLDDVPRTTCQCLLTVAILAIGLWFRWLVTHRRTA